MRTWAVAWVAAVALCGWPGASAAAPGDLDTTFGSGGIAAGPIGSGWDVALSADGPLVAGVVECGEFGDDFGLARFAWDGVARGDTCVDSGYYVYDRVVAMALQPDGKVLLAGSHLEAGPPTGPRMSALMRLLPDGTPDPAFGDAGKVYVDLAPDSNEGATGVAVLPDGRIVVSVFGGSGDGRSLAAARFLPDGRLDPSFADSGVAYLPADGPGFSPADVALQPDGGILLGGAVFTHDGGRFAVARLAPSGEPDPGFGSAGVALAPVGDGRPVGAALELQPDGRILAVGAGHIRDEGANDQVFAVARFTVTGGLDPGFGSGGVALTRVGSENPDCCDGLEATASDITVQRNGRLVVGGRARVYREGAYDVDLAVVRYEPDGTLDTTFGSDGLALTRIAGAVEHVGVALQEDGRIVVGGVDGLSAVRYEGDPAPGGAPAPAPTTSEDGGDSTGDDPAGGGDSTADGGAPSAGAGSGGSAGAPSAPAESDQAGATAADDSRSGGAGADRLAGGPGADTLAGAAGDDRIAGGSGADRLDGGPGRDHVTGDQGDDRIAGGEARDVLSGDSGDDEIHGGAGSDIVDGGAGHDAISGGERVDSLNGGAGDDRVRGGAGDDGISGASGRDHLFGGTGDDRLDGGLGQDLIDGGDGGDNIVSIDGQPDDVRCGTGRDVVRADGGDRVAADCERVIERPGRFGKAPDTDREESRDGAGSPPDGLVALAPFPGTGGCPGNGGSRLDGTGRGDVLESTLGGDCLFGLAGDDLLSGAHGADSLDGGTGADVLSGSHGGDVLGGGGARDVLEGGPDRDHIDGGAASDVVNGAAGDDRITGGPAGDSLNGGSDEDTIMGQDGDDGITGASGRDRIDGGDGDDRIAGGLGQDRLAGGRGDDSLVAVDGQRDVVRCGAGRDVVRADGGDAVSRDCELVIARRDDRYVVTRR